METVGSSQRGVLSTRECVDALRAGRVARVGVVDDGSPLVLPFSYVVSGGHGSVPGTEAVGVRIFVHVTTDGAVSRAGGQVCVELDEVIEHDGVAWSVVATGRIRLVDPEELPAGHAGRPEEWRVIDVDSITGRRFTATAAVASGFSVEWEVEG